MTPPPIPPSRTRHQPRLPAAGAAGQVVATLRTLGPLTRGDLGGALGLSRTTVSATVASLMQEGWVDEHPASAASTRGRPPMLLALTQRAGVAVGVDLGRSHARVVLAHLGHEVVAERAVELGGEADGDGALPGLVTDLVQDLLAEAGVAHDDIVGLGLGLPTPLDPAGHAASTTIAPGWARQDLAHHLQQVLSVPVSVDNDANLGALAEARWGGGRRAHTLFYLKASTGVGAGIVLGGRLFRGSGGTAGEIGHVTVDADGLVCRCGSRGCLEVRIGAPALVAQVGHSRTGIETLGDLIAAAQGGDLACQRVLADAGEALGVAVAGVLNLLNPDRVVLGGELGAAGELVLSSLRETLGRHALASAVRGATVSQATLGPRAEALGAALLVLTEGDRFVVRPR